MQKITFETGLEKMDRILIDRIGRGREFQEVTKELQKQPLAAGKYRVSLEKSYDFHLARTLVNE